ncbi:hypothetical protein L9F63_009821 [Diploptera punctata]|uniref:Gustatory receptor n=1 Tax=Diploptera punctata TaxID=6984 RepID=A0AAD8AIM9_DIPPU|nr:hypothetical protein L9F63_009821 [Diploptera punctata]
MKSTDIDSTFKLINTLSKVAGFPFLPEEGRKNSGNKLSCGSKSSPFLLFYSCSLIIFLILITSCLIYFHFINIIQLEFVGDIHIFQISITVSTGIINLIITSLKLRNNIYIMINKMSVLDNLLKTENKMKLKYTHMSREKIFFCVIAYIILVLTDFLIFTKGSLSFAYILDIDLGLYIHMVTAIQYVYFIYYVRERLVLLNSYIMTSKTINVTSRKTLFSELGIIQFEKNNCETFLSDEFIFPSEEKQTNAIISGASFTYFEYFKREKLHFQLLRVAQESLCDICSIINDMYGFQILLFFITIFTELTSNFYYQILCIASFYGENSLMILPSIWTMFYFTLIFVSTVVCHLASEEGNRSGVLLHRLLLIPELHSETVSEIKLFLHQVKYRKIKFTAWDIFTINLKNIRFYCRCCYNSFSNFSAVS